MLSFVDVYTLYTYMDGYMLLISALNQVYLWLVQELKQIMLLS